MLAEKGLAAFDNIDFEKAQPLIDDLLGCCSRIVEKVEERCTPETVDNYILDVRTLVILRMEVIKLHLTGILAAQDFNAWTTKEVRR